MTYIDKARFYDFYETFYIFVIFYDTYLYKYA